MTTKAWITLGEGVAWSAPMLFTSNKIRFSSVKVNLYLYELMKADILVSSFTSYIHVGFYCILPYLLLTFGRISQTEIRQPLKE